MTDEREEIIFTPEGRKWLKRNCPTLANWMLDPDSSGWWDDEGIPAPDIFALERYITWRHGISRLVQYGVSEGTSGFKYRTLCDGNLEYHLKKDSRENEEIVKIKTHNSGSVCKFSQAMIKFTELSLALRNAIQNARAERNFPPLTPII